MKKLYTRIKQKARNLIQTVKDGVARIRQRVEKRIIATTVTAQTAATSAGKALACQKGESYVDTALKILICVVLGALLLTTLYMIFKDNVLKTLNERITELFNYKG